MNDAAAAIGNSEFRRRSRLIERAAEHGDFAEAPDAGVGDVSLADTAGKAGQVEPFAALEVLGERDAEVGATCALRLHFELVDAGEIGGADLD